MGLDITAYKGLSVAPGAAVDEDGNPLDWDKHHAISRQMVEFTEREFPGRTEGLTPGVYAFADSHAFRAGSYGGYSAWRDWLARVGGWDSAESCWRSAKDGPFSELINFSDCEGVIGPKVAAKLAKDFAEHEPKAAQMAEGEDYYLEKYREWQKACELAADNGAIDFH